SAEFALGALDDYIAEVKGDTLVIKDFGDMEPDAAGSLREAVVADSVEVPAGRVYELKANGYYPLSTNLTTPATRAVVIVGADDTRLVQNANASSAPPIICGFGSNTGGISFQNDLTVKNCSIIQAADKATLGWAFFGAAASNKTLRVENCLFEHTRWVMIQSNDAAGTNVYINDCYFVNMSGQACRRNGGVYDNVNNNTATMWVENSTHVMAQGMIYKFRNYPVDRIVFNHNTFVNMSGNVFETLGYQRYMVVVNNIFVNSNLQPYLTGLDAGETDADNLPMGIINIDTLPSGYENLPRKMLVDKNVVYWDPKFADMVQTCKTNLVNFSDDWHDQMITMNTRTQAMFDDNTNYPYLIEGTWYEKCPNFTDPKDLLTVGVDSIKAFSVGTVDTTSGDVLMVWRKVATDLNTDYIYSDWPIPVNLAYDDADLLEGGLGGFPVGDLNWFPTQKAAWEAQKNTELSAINDQLSIKETAKKASNFKLNQNFPNPFNPTTTISYTIPKSGNVTLKVFNMLGHEVATLVDGYNNANQAYSIEFDGTSLSSGVYFYTLTFDNKTVSKKMVLMK
ncbi:MAG: T9SS type A sorting domain-containing protein, partial [Candidatus Neomarinimicrobiota bacterium]